MYMLSSFRLHPSHFSQCVCVCLGKLVLNFETRQKKLAAADTCSLNPIVCYISAFLCVVITSQEKNR